MNCDGNGTGTEFYEFSLSSKYRAIPILVITTSSNKEETEPKQDLLPVPAWLGQACRQVEGIQTSTTQDQFKREERKEGYKEIEKMLLILFIDTGVVLLKVKSKTKNGLERNPTKSTTWTSVQGCILAAYSDSSEIRKWVSCPTGGEWEREAHPYHSVFSTRKVDEPSSHEMT